MKFYDGPKFLFSNMMTCHTFDVDIIIKTLLTNTNMVTSINHVSNDSICVENAYVMKFYAYNKNLKIVYILVGTIMLALVH
jgi:hypothetical protein